MEPHAVHNGHEPDAGLLSIARHHLSNRRDANTRGSRLQVSNLTRQTVLADRLEVADHGANRRKGLLGRAGLAAGEGLWIKPCEAVHTFFMQFPIDLVYLDSKNRIRKVRSGVAPWRMSACLSAHSVLELPSGTIEATQTRPGDWLQFDAAMMLE